MFVKGRFINIYHLLNLTKFYMYKLTMRVFFNFVNSFLSYFLTKLTLKYIIGLIVF